MKRTKPKTNFVFFVPFVVVSSRVQSIFPTVLPFFL